MSTGIENPISPSEAARDLIARLQALEEAIAGPDVTTLTIAERRRGGVTAAVRESFFQSVLPPGVGAASRGGGPDQRGRTASAVAVVQEFTAVVEEVMS